MDSKDIYKILQVKPVVHVFQIVLLSVIITRTLSIYSNTYISVDLSNTSYCANKNDTIHSEANSSFLECLVQCWIRPGCNGVNYKRRFSYCALFNETTFTKQPGCLHIPRQHIYVHPNNTVACNGTQTNICNLLNSSQGTTECRQIANVNFGQVLGNIYNIGSRLFVTCDKGYTLTGNYSSIGCMTDGQWSDTPTCMATGMSSTAPPSPTTVTIQQSSQTPTSAPPTTTQTSTTSTPQSPTTTTTPPPSQTTTPPPPTTTTTTTSTTTTQPSTTSTPTQTTHPPSSTSSTTTTITQPPLTTHPPPTTAPIQTTSPPSTVTITSTTTTHAPTTTTIALTPTTTTSATGMSSPPPTTTPPSSPTTTPVSPTTTTQPSTTSTPTQTTNPPSSTSSTTTITQPPLTTHPPPTTAPVQTTSPPSSTHSTTTTTHAPTTTTIALTPTTTTSAKTSCVDSCIGLTDGNYQSCNTCTGYIACNGGYLYNMQCPGGVSWDDNLKTCTYTSATCP